jgi:hypothetical protein
VSGPTIGAIGEGPVFGSPLIATGGIASTAEAIRP